MNLSTRPFYNERGVYCVIGIVGLLGLLVMAGTAGRVIVLFEENTKVATEVEELERVLAATMNEKSHTIHLVLVHFYMLQQFGSQLVFLE